MPTQIFVNIPTTDLERSKHFYEGLRWTINPNLTDENAACVIVSVHIYLMILTREFFATFTDKPTIDPATSLQTQTGLSADSREGVDALAEKAKAAGAHANSEAQDYGFMYSRDFDDPDGNHFAIL